MNNLQMPDFATRAKLIAGLRQTRREIAEFNQELAEIEAQFDSLRRGYANESCTLRSWHGLVKVRRQLCRN